MRDDPKPVAILTASPSTESLTALAKEHASSSRETIARVMDAKRNAEAMERAAYERGVTDERKRFEPLMKALAAGLGSIDAVAGDVELQDIQRAFEELRRG